MQDTPDPVDLLRAVAGFLREHAMPQLSGHAAFHARVAANTLDIVIRQLHAQAIDEPAERTRLQRLLAYESHDLAELNRLLCRRIEDGSLTLADPALADHLWRTTMEKLAVDQPRYETYRRLAAD